VIAASANPTDWIRVSSGQRRWHDRTAQVRLLQGLTNAADAGVDAAGRVVHPALLNRGLLRAGPFT